VGTISQLAQAATEAVAAPGEEARTFVHAQRVAHLDETRWRQGRPQAWLWVAVTRVVTVFVVRLSRGADVARALLGEAFSGLLVTDRSSAYHWYPGRWRQVCWAHL
jgi:transposase